MELLNRRKRGTPMKIKFALVIALIVLATAITTTSAFGQKLYPVQGPLASQTPPQVFSVKVQKRLFGAGTPTKYVKTWIVAGGEEVNGKFEGVTANSMNAKTPGAADSYPPQPNLAFAWDAVYGQGFFAAHILGKKMWQGTFTGDKGTVLQIELMNDNDLRGVAVDNQGNVYKEVWSQSPPQRSAP
jgi:hypothetical protein